MPISDLDPAALAMLKPSDLVGMALHADQEARRLRRAGDLAGAAVYDLESLRLLALYHERD